MTDPDQSLVELLQTKAPEELTPAEIETLRAALAHSPALQQAMAERLEMERYLSAGLGAPSFSADRILAGAGRMRPQTPWRPLTLLKWVVCLLLIGFVGSVL